VRGIHRIPTIPDPLQRAADGRLDSGTSAAVQCTLGTHDFEPMQADGPRPSRDAWLTAKETVKSAFHKEHNKGTVGGIVQSEPRIA
jgi:hypothetical protein